jgi:hypothetical protein
MQPVSCVGCQALQRRLHDLQAENERLRRQLDGATLAGKRQAATFAKGRPAGQPKKPGNDAGFVLVELNDDEQLVAAYCKHGVAVGPSSGCN